MSLKQQCVGLNDGHLMPLLGYGTSQNREVSASKIFESTKIAIDTGFRHIDSAYVYKNEKETGQAIRSKIADGVVKREDIFLTTKLWCTFHRPELVQVGLERSLKNFQLEFVDLYLIHFPISIKAMEKCKDAGLAKSIGVSNFNRRQLEMILNKPGLKYKPVCNQVECHPYLNQSKLLDFCKSRDIILVAYAALGSQRPITWVDQNAPFLLNDPVLCSIAKKHNRSPAQIALRYQVQRGVVALAHSYEQNEMKENIQVFEFQLPLEDMEVLDGLNRNFRYFPLDIAAEHPNFPFSDEY
ncbi:aldo-keto reductase family 1 member C1 homolog isoform X2 [Grammomys surdaster]|uniref:aldo-keto reductase family 1 member C1 homolog isoform X2 n=1 Tax=Grammomys surdaster TaxID=491861 RepID=UPI0010A0681A|nr:aldo-keto reductase family 1 member C1 homolog isoform X2 [Grammomys surdaster]